MWERLNNLNKQEETVTKASDGAYAGAGNAARARKKNIGIVTTKLAGRETRDIAADFTFSEDGKEILSCPAGNVPKRPPIMRQMKAARLPFMQIFAACAPIRLRAKQK